MEISTLKTKLSEETGKSRDTEKCIKPGAEGNNTHVLGMFKDKAGNLLQKQD